MHFDERSAITHRYVAILTLTACVTIGGTSMAGTNVLFEQPTEGDIAGNIYVAHVTKGGMPMGTFDLLVEQPDPLTSSGNLVHTLWDAGAKTGFVPGSPSTAQLGFLDVVGATTAQMEGGTVGAYLNSKDLPTKLTSQKMMIAPRYGFPAGATPVPFASSTGVLNAELDLQVPVAVGSDTYVAADLLFVGPNGVRVSYGVKLFHNESRLPLLVGSDYDVPDNSYMLNCPVGAEAQYLTYLTTASTSSAATGTPWLGWRHFQWTINQAQFTAALKRLNAQYPTKVESTDPTQYVFSEVHLNAEFHYSPAPAELGWSMRGLKIWE
jgi:hypothetical protein